MKSIQFMIDSFDMLPTFIFSRMSKYPPIETDLYEKILLSTWNITSNLESTYPTEIANWVKHHSTVKAYFIHIFPSGY